MKDKNSIKLYAPVDGTIFELKHLNDGVFSEKMLGDGCFIIPENENFKSCIDEGSVQLVTDTKHALYLTNELDINLLMHIGLDTVTLKGKPFKVGVKQGDKLTLNTDLVKVDLKKIEKVGLPTNTIMVLDPNKSPGWEFKIKKNNCKVKQGEEIGEFRFTKKLDLGEDINLDFLEEKSTYEKTAEVIYNAVQGQSNFGKVHSCMTRLRLEISDPNKVEIDKIKKLSLVKGVNWSGNQLQVIIGGEVFKVLDSFNVLMQKISNPSTESNLIKTKTSLRKKLVSAVTGVIMPALPLLIASGLLSGLKSVLVMTGLVTDMGIGSGVINTNVDPFSLFINIISETGLKLFGIYIGYNTCKYLGGNTLMQLFMGLAISGSVLGLSVTQWDFFAIGNFSIKVGIYSSSILPHIASAIILFHIEKWVKTWVPASLDIILRPLITMTVTFATVFFVVGPVLFLIESGLGWLIGKLALIPFGFGSAIFAFLWQPLVLTGMHVTAAMPIIVANTQGFYSPLLVALNIATFAQLGAAIGVIICTKNSQLRAAGIASIPGALVGVTEPAIYGINLPKFRPFIAGIVGAGIAGLFTGLLGVEARVLGGGGILGFTSAIGEPRYAAEIINGVLVDPSSINIFTGTANSLTTNLILWFVVNIAGLVLPIILTMLVYQERPIEKKQIKKISDNLIKYYKLSGSKELSLDETDKLQLEKIINYVTPEDNKKIKELESFLSKLSKTQDQLDKQRSIEEKQKQRIIVSIKKIMNKEPIDKEKIVTLKSKFDKISKSETIPNLELNIQNQQNQIAEQLNWLNKWQKDFLSLTGDFINQAVLNCKVEELKNFNADYFNAIHSLDINFLISEKDEKTFNKKDFKLSKK